MLKKLGIPHKSISSLQFSCFSADEIRRLSFKKVTNPHSLDVLSNPTEGGLYDTTFGASGKDEVCSTCGLGSAQCPGHLGHIDLPLPIYHPLFFKTLYYLLRGSCFTCQRLLIPREKLMLFDVQLDAIKSGMVQTVYALNEACNEAKISTSSMKGDNNATLEEIEQNLKAELKKHYAKLAKKSKDNPNPVDDKTANGWSRNAMQLHLDLVQEFMRLLAKKRSICPHCSSQVGTLRAELNSKIFMTDPPEKGSKVAPSQSHLSQSTIMDHVCKLWRNEKTVLSRVFVAMTDTSAGSHFDRDVFKIKDEDGKDEIRAANVFFLTALPVPPSRFRPLGMINEMQFESPQTTAYSKVLMDCNIVRALMKKLDQGETVDELSEVEQDVTAMGKLLKRMKNKQGDLLAGVPGKTLPEKLGNAWNRLQQHVNSLFDSDLDRLSVTMSEKTPGIKQILEKKDGLFRKHMMGKRVNFAARSVISPDPYIATNEIGVPMVFATKLTYPTPVTPWNLRKLRQAVINGPMVHPGATHVVAEDRTTILSGTDKTQREAVAKQLNVESTKFGVFSEPKVVLRHIESGDVMLLNRQPTLHKGSIMAHKVRVLPNEKTLRLHYANCKSYNADFDGDEMNAHFPQTEHCRSEGYNLMLTDKQYLSGKDGKPLSCLIQDHMVAGVNISMRGTFFKRSDYQHLLYNALMHLPYKIKLLKPCILKPQPMWSGKQIFSTLMMNIIPAGSPFINLKGTSKIRAKNWQNEIPRFPICGVIEPGEMCESEVIIRDGELLCGVLDKAHYGATEHGLVHATYELYGGEISGRLLTCLARLFTCYLQQYKGFTLGVEDILVTASANSGRRSVIEETKDGGFEVVAKTLSVADKNNAGAVTDALWSAHVDSLLPSCKSEDKLAAVDHAMKKVSNSVNDEIAKWCTGDGLIKTFPNNNLQLMVISGAKGGAVNCMQISCLLGQIELEGRRPPLMPSGRSAPSFKPYDTTLRAGGFISQRFLTGIRPQEYFYHCMAGREGLVDTAVKTSRSGYLQRCLIKHLEGLMLAYDMTVRDSDGGVLQFLYGEDGVDVANTSYLQQKNCSLMVDNHKAIEKKLPCFEQISSYLDCRTSSKKWKKFLKAKKKQRKYLNKHGLEELPRTSAFLEFANEQESGNISVLSQMWRELNDEGKQKYLSKATKYLIPDPVASSYRPDLFYGAVSENFFKEMKDYLQRNPCNLPKDENEKPVPGFQGLTLEKLETLLKTRYQRSLCQPGESVGLLAAQSIGEPSTQMTLNTFHFAGRGEMNVTLGIPRLREILLVASKEIKTPQVTIPVLPGRERRARRLCKELTKVILSQVLNKFTVEERLVVTGCGGAGDRYRRCSIKLDILPQSAFNKEMALDRDTVLRYIEKQFFRFLLVAIGKKMKKRAEEGLIVDQRVAREASRRTETGDFDQVDEFHDTDTQLLEEKEEKESGGGGGGDEEEEEGGDGDAGAEEQKRRKRDDVDYEEQDNVDPEEDNPINYDIVNDDTMNDVTLGQGDVTMLDDNMEEDEGSVGESLQDAADTDIRIQSVKNLGYGSISVEDYEFDSVDAGWCKVTLLMPLTAVQVDIVSIVRGQAEIRAVRSVPGLTRCILAPPQGDSTTSNFVTEGINFHKMFENEDSLDVNKLYCNSVHLVAGMYGIEAARRVVVKEIANVFAVYGIEVDPRHLSLIGDYMCYEGKYRPFNRIGIESCVSPLQQMSFETTMSFLKRAALHGMSDRLKSPSARIVAGRIVKAGTGSFDLLYPVRKFIS